MKPEKGDYQLKAYRLMLILDNT